MAKIRVPVWGTIGKSVVIETSPQAGATIGTNLKLPDGSTPTLAQLSAALTPADALHGLSPTIWRLIREVPANVQQVAALATSGLVTRRSTGAWVTRSIAVADTARLTVADAPGESGDPTLDMADIAAISVWGRSAATIGKPAPIVSSGDKAMLHQSGTTLDFSTVDHTYVSDFSEAVDDRVAALIQNGTGISWSYNDPAGALAASIDQTFTPTWTGLHTFTADVLASRIDIGSSEVMVLNGTPLAAQLQINSDTLAISEIHTHSSAGATFGAVAYGARARGSEAVPAAVANGDYLYRVIALGHDGTDYAAGAAIDFVVDGVPGANDMPTKIVFSTTPDGAQIPVEALSISAAQIATFAQPPAVPNDSWAYAKIQNVSATSRVLGRITAGAGDIEELTAADLVTIIGGSGGGTLAGLTDVNLTSPTDKQALVYDTATSKWINALQMQGVFVRGASFASGVAAITTPTNDVPIEIPFDCAISKVIVLTRGGTGSCVLDIWRKTYAAYPPTVSDSITASALPTISAGIKYSDSTLTGWGTALSAGDTLLVHLVSSSTFTAIAVFLELTPVGSTAFDGYTDERAQDAVGGILTDSSTVDFTYDDAGNSITASVITAGLDLFTSGVRGLVPASGGGTTTFLCANGTFAVPPAGTTMLMAVKAADSTKTSDNTVAADTDLVITFPTAGTYEFEAFLAFWEQTSGAGGFQMDIGGGTATITANLWGVLEGNVGSTQGLTSRSTSVQAGSISITSGTPDWFLAKGSVTVTVAGTFAIRWAQVNSNVNATTLKALSYLTALKLV